MRKSIIVLAGSEWQIPLVKRLKEQDYYTVVFNLYESSPAFAYADEYVVVDLLDKEKCLKYAKEFNPIGVITAESDIAVPMVAYLADNLGLPSIGTKMAELYTDKSMMRDFAKKIGFSIPRYRLCEKVEAAEEFFLEINGKAIIKPINSNDSKGVKTIREKHEIRECFDDTIAYSRGKRAVLVEEYIDGTEFTVDGIKTQAGHSSLAISQKKHYKSAENVACQLLFENHNEVYDYNELQRLNDLYVDQSELPFGLTHAEYKYRNGRFYMIEIGARGGGNRISTIIEPFMSGIDVYDYLIKMTVGKTVAEKVTPVKKNYDYCAVLDFFNAKEEGKLIEIRGLDYLSACEKIPVFGFQCKVGEQLNEATDDSKRAGYYIAFGENRKELDYIIHKTKDNVKLIVEDCE